MTPWHLTVASDAYHKINERRHNHDAWMMYHNAVLFRWGGKNFPPLNQFRTDSKKQVPFIDEAAIMARMKAFNDRLEEENGTGSKTNR